MWCNSTFLPSRPVVCRYPFVCRVPLMILPDGPTMIPSPRTLYPCHSKTAAIARARKHSLRNAKRQKLTLIRFGTQANANTDKESRFWASKHRLAIFTSLGPGRRRPRSPTRDAFPGHRLLQDGGLVSQISKTRVGDSISGQPAGASHLWHARILCTHEIADASSAIQLGCRMSVRHIRCIAGRHSSI